MGLRVDPQECISGGYFLTRWVDTPEGLGEPPALLPRRLFSASDCIADFLPGWWARAGWEGEGPTPQQEARNWGIDPARVPELLEWVRARFDAREMGWISVFSDLAVARNLVQRFRVPMDDLVLFGIGLREAHVNSYLADAKPEHEVRPSGMFEMVSRHLRMVPGGTPLGYEPLDDEYGGPQFHTWLCNDIHKYAFEALGIRPNEHGFLDSFEDACRVTDSVSREDIEAEPGLWLPWLIVAYPLE